MSGRGHLNCRPSISRVAVVGLPTTGATRANRRRVAWALALLGLGCARVEPTSRAVAPWAEVLRLSRLDARGEYLRARKLLDAGQPRPELEALLDEPPPWPPASIQKMRAEADGPALIDSLAAQIAPEAGERAWLLTSWTEPPRPIDDALFADLRDARGGRLDANPRLHAWLRAEWTAWLEQRGRRVARRAVEP